MTDNPLLTPGGRAESRRICDAATLSVALPIEGRTPIDEVSIRRLGVHARTALPAVLDALDAAEKRIAELQAKLVVERAEFDRRIDEAQVASSQAEHERDQLRREIAEWERLSRETRTLHGDKLAEPTSYAELRKEVERLRDEVARLDAEFAARESVFQLARQVRDVLLSLDRDSWNEAIQNLLHRFDDAEGAAIKAWIKRQDREAAKAEEEKPNGT